MRIALVLALTALSFTGCKKKDAEPAAAEAEPAPKAAAMTVEHPDTPEGKKFAEKLIANGLSNINPTGSSNFSMSFVFKGNGQWTATGLAELGGETLECEEAGKWKVEDMVEEKGRLEWTIERSNCPNRSAGDSQRALVAFDGKDATVSFR